MAFPLLINFLFITLVGARKPPIETFSLPIPTMNGSTNLAQFAGYQALDTNYVTTPNATSYEWWYFDTVASDLSASVVFQPSITYGYPESSLDLRFSIAFPDGTEKEFIIPKQSLHLSTIGEASVGVAGDGSFSWVGSPSLSTYTINLDLADIGVKGEIQLQSIAPPHVACSAATIGASLEFHWDLFWVNLVPDAVAYVNLDVNGSTLAFEGSGYHDKNWGPFGFMPYLNQWYWGHGRAGDLSVVWFYRIDVDGSIAASAYIAEGGEILWTGCGDGVVVRPYGSGVQYPLPVNNSATIEGFTINIDTPSLGSFAFTAQQNRSVVSPAPYDRWIGEFTGGPVGGMNASGFGLWEKMSPFSPDVAPPS